MYSVRCPGNIFGGRRKSAGFTRKAKCAIRLSEAAGEKRLQPRKSGNGGGVLEALRILPVLGGEPSYLRVWGVLRCSLLQHTISHTRGKRRAGGGRGLSPELSQRSSLMPKLLLSGGKRSAHLEADLSLCFVSGFVFFSLRFLRRCFWGFFSLFRVKALRGGEQAESEWQRGQRLQQPRERSTLLPMQASTC